MDAIAVGRLPGASRALRSSSAVMLLRLEDDVLAVVELPVVGEDAALALEAL